MANYEIVERVEMRIIIEAASREEAIELAQDIPRDRWSSMRTDYTARRTLDAPGRLSWRAMRRWARRTTMAKAVTFFVLGREGALARPIGSIEFHFPEWIARRMDAGIIGRFASRKEAADAVRGDGAALCDCLFAPAGPDGLCAVCRAACEEIKR